MEDVEVVGDADAEDGGHVVDVEVEADPERELGDVLGGSTYVLLREVDGDEAGEVLEGRLKFLAECSWVKLCASSLHFFWWDVSAFDGGEGPAFPVIVVLSSETPKVVEPAGGAFGVEINRAHPCLSARAGRSTSNHTPNP